MTSSNKPIQRRTRKRTRTGAAAKTESQYAVSCQVTAGLFRWLSSVKTQLPYLDSKERDLMAKIISIHDEWMLYLDDYS